MVAIVAGAGSAEGHSLISDKKDQIFAMERQTDSTDTRLSTRVFVSLCLGWGQT